MMRMHPGQLDLTSEQVRLLVSDQFPQWSALPIRPVASAGTVNALYRVGEGLVARFPLLGTDASTVRAQLEEEAERSAELAASSPVPVPVPVAIGEPGHGYHLPWAVQTWLEGVDAFTDDPGESIAFAADLGDFVAGLRRVDARGRTWRGPGRGGELPSHDEWVETCLAASTHLVDVPRVRALWQELRVLPRPGADVMSHTDLIPGNVLVRGGRLVGVLDGGGFGPADPALDLVAAWHLLEPGPRRVFRERVGCTRLEWERGRAWALEQAMGAVWYYEHTNPPMSRMGIRTVARLLAGTAAEPVPAPSVQDSGS